MIPDSVLLAVLAGCALAYALITAHQKAPRP